MLNYFKKKPVKHRAGITLLILLLLMFIAVSVSFAFFTDHSVNNIKFSTVSAVDYDYTLSGAINGGTETTITSTNDEVLLIINEDNNEETDLYSKITLTAEWQGDTDISTVRFMDTVTGYYLPVNVDSANGNLTIQFKSNKIYADNSLTHKIKVFLPDGLNSDILNFHITSDVSAVKDSWAETVGPVNLKLHLKIKYPTKLEVADTSAHRDAYLIGNDFDSTDLILTVTYNTGETAEITYKALEDSYYIDKGDGRGKVLLTNNDFHLRNIINLEQIKFMQDWAEGGSGSNYEESFTFTYNDISDNYLISGEIAEELWVEENSFLETYINSGKYTIALNGSDVTGGGTGTNSDGTDTFIFTYYSRYKEYLVERQYSYNKTLTLDAFLSEYVDSRNYEIVLNNKSETPISGTYPHASYIEAQKTVECDIPITVGNAVIQAWGEYDVTDFHNYKPDVTSVVFQNTYQLPNSITDGPWDVSRDDDHSVMAYLVGTDVYICSNIGTEAKVIANEDSGYIFTNFTETKTIDASNFDTASAKTMNNMFEWCWKLETLDTTGWNTSNVTNMNSTFMQAGNNMDLDLSHWNVSNVTDMRYMFWAYGNYMKTLDLSGWDVSSVQYADEMFYEQRALTTIGDTSSWKFTSLIEAPYMFVCCVNLEELDTSGWDMSNLKNAEAMFSGCSKLGTLDVSDWNTAKLQNAENMFSYCELLDGIDIKNWNCSAMVVNSGMFSGCSALTKLTIPASMKELQSSFASYCDNLTDITFLHTPNNTLTFAAPGYSGPFRVSDSYSSTPLKTNVKTNNTATKTLVYNHLWNKDYRSLLFDITVVNTDGGSVKENTNDLTAWSSYPIGMSLTPEPNDGYEFTEWTVTYTNTAGTKQTVTLAQDELSTFVMPYANITVTPSWKITKVPIKLEVAVPPDETYYVPGENYNPTGVEFTVTYDDNSTASIIYNGPLRKYLIDKTPNNGENNYVVLTDENFIMTNITNLKEVYTYTPAVDYKKGGTGLDYNGDMITFAYNETTGYYEVTFESNGNTYNYDESTFLSYYAENDSYTITPNDTPVETKVGTLPHAAYTENGVTVECDVIITVAAPILKNTYGYMTTNVSILDRTDLLSYLENGTITEVEFVDSLHGLDKSTMDYADVSAKQNGSVLAWVDGNTLFVGGKTGVYANEQLTGLFRQTYRNGTNYRYDDITSIDVSGLKIIGENDKGYPVTTNISQAFYGCSALTEIKGLESWNPSSVTDMSGLFARTAITEITGVADWDTSNVESMSSMFYEVATLTDVSELEGWNTGKVKSTANMFYRCTSLTDAPIANWNFSSLANDYWDNNHSMFAECTNLNNLVIPASMSHIGDGFANDCGSLVNITFKHGPNDILTFTDADYYLYLPFYVGKATDAPYIETSISLPNDENDVVKDKIIAYDWQINNRTVLFGTAMLTLDLNGGEIIE